MTKAKSTKKSVAKKNVETVEAVETPWVDTVEVPSIGKYNRCAVKLNVEDTMKVESILRAAGESELADKYLAKLTAKESGPRLVKVRSDESRKIMIEVETDRVEASELQKGDACVLQGQVKFFFDSIKDGVAKFTKTVTMRNGKERVYDKEVADSKFTKIVG